MIGLRRYTILHTIETGGPGGAETVLLELASGLDPSRFRSLALLPGGNWLPRMLEERNVPTVQAKSSAWYDPRLPRAMARVIKDERVDLIHSHLADQNFYSCLVGRLTGCRVIVTYHGLPELCQNSGMRSAAKAWLVRHSAAAVVVVSDYLREALTNARFPPERIQRIYNGIDARRFAKKGMGILRAELRFGPDIKLIGMVANLRQSKGYEHFIEASHKVIAAFPQARFVAAGEIEEEMLKRLTGRLRQLNLLDRFVFLGFRADVPEVLSNLDVFVLSSTSEGLSIATIEAMAAGKPVVVTRSGGPQEIIQDGQTGLLVAPSDSEALAAGICRILRDPKLAEGLGRNAQHEAERRFSLTRMITEYESLYERCLASP